MNNVSGSLSQDLLCPGSLLCPVLRNLLSVPSNSGISLSSVSPSFQTLRAGTSLGAQQPNGSTVPLGEPQFTAEQGLSENPGIDRLVKGCTSVKDKLSTRKHGNGKDALQRGHIRHFKRPCLTPVNQQI